MQSVIPARSRPARTAGPFVATLVGIPAMVIVLAAVSDAGLPVVGSGRGPLIALWVLVSVMCSQGIVAMRDRYGVVRANLVGLPLGLAATALILSAIFGWTALLQPIVDAMSGTGSPVSLDRAAIVGVGVIMAVKWAVAWLSYLPVRESDDPARAVDRS